MDDVLIHNQPGYAAKYTPNAFAVAEAGWRDFVVRMGNGAVGNEADPLKVTFTQEASALGGESWSRTDQPVSRAPST